MAVTGFWPVIGDLKATLDYADNPDKTTAREYLDEDLYAALRYVKNDDKTDRQVYVGGINCSSQNAYAEMIAVQKRYGNRGKVVGYHGIQSFVAGEVTPDEAFEIGKETARRMWGDKYQVLVTVHLNTDNIHCHFVVNPISFVDGSKFQNKIGYHKELRKVSDAVCREHGKSVLENSEFYSKGKKKEYWLNQSGKKSHKQQLRAMEYEIDPVRFSVKAKGWERAVRLKTIGFERDAIFDRFEQNLFSDDGLFNWNSHLPYKPKVFPLENALRKLAFSVEHSYDPATVIVDTLFLIILTIFKLVDEVADVMLLSPDLRHEAQDFKKYLSDFHFLKENGIHTVSQLSAELENTKTEISELEHRRSLADNKRRRASPEEKQQYKDERKQITEHIAPLRKRLKQAEQIYEISPHLYELLQNEHRLEKQAQQRLRERSR